MLAQLQSLIWSSNHSASCVKRPPVSSRPKRTRNLCFNQLRRKKTKQKMPVAPTAMARAQSERQAAPNCLAYGCPSASCRKNAGPISDIDHMANTTKVAAQNAITPWPSDKEVKDNETYTPAKTTTSKIATSFSARSMLLFEAAVSSLKMMQVQKQKMPAATLQTMAIKGAVHARNHMFAAFEQAASMSLTMSDGNPVRSFSCGWQCVTYPKSATRLFAVSGKAWA
mmetsp:Transcript_65080/g.128001  ORF Transcript_65080/g.128001 Transcript_65080/m.128001 type:complete len:226 (+) Transcript_65080:168-845(+)